MEIIQTPITADNIIQPPQVELLSDSDMLPVLKLRCLSIGSDIWTTNRSYYPADEIKSAAPSIMYKPVTIDHIPDYIIGCITEKDVKEENSNIYLYTVSDIWEFRFLEEAERIKQLAKDGELFVSTEALPRYVECATCHKEFPYFVYRISPSRVCSHLRTTHERILHDFEFLGQTIVFPPKEPAYTNAVAELLTRELLRYLDISPEEIAKLSDEQLMKLHKEVHDAYEKLRRAHKRHR